MSKSTDTPETSPAKQPDSSTKIAGGTASVGAGGNIEGSEVTIHNVTNNYHGQPPESPKDETAKIPTPSSNLPPKDPNFRGREEDLTKLITALKTEPGTATISALKGIGGIGKTELAVHAAYALADTYPRAQILVPLDGVSDMPLSPRAAMEFVIRRLHPKAQLPDDEAAIADIYKDVLRQEATLLILDNAKDAAQVSPLLPPSPSAAIITSRARLVLLNKPPIELGDLERAKAIEVLGEYLSNREVSEAALNHLAAACVDHPLSLKIAGSYLSQNLLVKIEAYASEIEKDRANLKLPDDEVAPDENANVMVVLGYSLKQLKKDKLALAERWRDLFVFPADFDLAAVAAIWGDGGHPLDETETQNDVQTLMKLGFIELEDEKTQRLKLHDLMRDLARQDAEGDRWLAPTLKHALHYLQVLSLADSRFVEGGSENAIKGLGLYDQEAQNIATGRARLVHLVEFGNTELAELVSDYADAGVYVLSLRLHQTERIKWLEDALAAVRSLNDKKAEGVHLGNLGNAYANLGQVTKAIEFYEAALSISREIGDKQGEGNHLGNLGLAYARLGEVTKAIEFYEAALTISREISDKQGEGNRLGNLGNAYARLGEVDKATGYMEKSLAIFDEIGSPNAEQLRRNLERLRVK